MIRSTSRRALVGGLCAAVAVAVVVSAGPASLASPAGVSPHLPAAHASDGRTWLDVTGRSFAAVDTTDRKAVERLYRDVIAPALRVPAQWTGNVARCRAGSVSKAYRRAELDTLNAVRALAGLPSVVESRTLSAKAQKSALITLANGRLSHHPPSGWSCWTRAGYEGSSTGNIYLGVAGAEAVLGYLTDSGDSNTAVGHRRWLLYPRLQKVGMGDTWVERWRASNTIVVLGGGWAPAGPPRWSPWPTAGYFPEPLFPQLDSRTSRWSLSYPEADFSKASVRMKVDGRRVKVVRHTPVDGYGDNTLVWDANTTQSSGEDRRYSVRVGGVVLPNGRKVSHTYSTVVFAPGG